MGSDWRGGYPVRVEGELDPNLNRWLWLVLTVVAFFAMLFTERYPRGIFEFNLGVMRWT